MLGNSIVVENMSHLVNGYPNASIDGRADSDDSIHFTQARKRKIKVQLLFITSTPNDPSVDFLDSLHENLPRIISVRIPKGFSVAHVRPLIKYIEGQLQDIFGKSKRANFCMVCEEGSELWTYDFTVPDIGVVYV